MQIDTIWFASVQFVIPLLAYCRAVSIHVGCAASRSARMPGMTINPLNTVPPTTITIYKLIQAPQHHFLLAVLSYVLSTYNWLVFAPKMPNEEIPSIELVPWDFESKEHTERMFDQRVSCGWRSDEVEEWTRLCRAGTKCMYWAVRRWLHDYGAPSAPCSIFFP